MGSKYIVEIDDDSFDSGSGSADIIDIQEASGVQVPGCVVKALVVMIILAALAYLGSGGGDCTTWTQNSTGDWYCSSTW